MLRDVLLSLSNTILSCSRCLLSMTTLPLTCLFNYHLPLMEAGSCVHNVMAFKWDGNGGKMAGAVLAHGVLLSRRKTPRVVVQQGRGSNVLDRGQDEIPLPPQRLSAVNDNQSTLLRTPHVWFEAIDLLCQFCPLLTNFKHVPILPFQLRQLSP